MEIDIKSLDNGVTSISKSIPVDEFNFEDKEFSGPIYVNLKAVKEKIGRVWIEGDIEAIAIFQCDRCLDTIKDEIIADVNLLIRRKAPQEEEEKEKNDYTIIEADSSEVDITKYLKDSILLSLPYKKLCSPDCKGICPECGVNLNKEDCDCGKKNVDPRLEQLKNLKNKMEDN